MSFAYQVVEQLTSGDTGAAHNQAEQMVIGDIKAVHNQVTSSVVMVASLVINCSRKAAELAAASQTGSYPFPLAMHTAITLVALGQNLAFAPQDLVTWAYFVVDLSTF